MSVMINIYYKGENGNAREFAEEMVSSGVVAAIRKEDGNERYDYFYPMNDSQTVLLIDVWRDQTAIDLHHASPMMKQITSLREKYGLHMTVERYTSDMGAITDNDRKFIKN